MNQQSKTSKQRKDLNRWLNCWILPNTWNRININLPQILSNYWRGDFPGFPVIKTLHFHCRGYTFNPWWAKFHMLWGVAKKKKKKPIQNTEEERTFSDSFHESSNTLIPKPDTDADTTRKENHRPISLWISLYKFSTKY